MLQAQEMLSRFLLVWCFFGILEAFPFRTQTDNTPLEVQESVDSQNNLNARLTSVNVLVPQRVETASWDSRDPQFVNDMPVFADVQYTSTDLVEQRGFGDHIDSPKEEDGYFSAFDSSDAHYKYNAYPRSMGLQERSNYFVPNEFHSDVWPPRSSLDLIDQTTIAEGYKEKENMGFSDTDVNVASSPVLVDHNMDFSLWDTTSIVANRDSSARGLSEKTKNAPDVMLSEDHDDLYTFTTTSAPRIVEPRGENTAFGSTQKSSKSSAAATSKESAAMMASSKTKPLELSAEEYVYLFGPYDMGGAEVVIPYSKCDQDADFNKYHLIKKELELGIRKLPPGLFKTSSSLAGQGSQSSTAKPTTTVNTVKPETKSSPGDDISKHDHLSPTGTLSQNEDPEDFNIPGFKRQDSLSPSRRIKIESSEDAGFADVYNSNSDPVSMGEQLFEDPGTKEGNDHARGQAWNDLKYASMSESDSVFNEMEVMQEFGLKHGSSALNTATEVDLNDPRRILAVELGMHVPEDYGDLGLTARSNVDYKASPRFSDITAEGHDPGTNVYTSSDQEYDSEDGYFDSLPQNSNLEDHIGHRSFPSTTGLTNVMDKTPNDSDVFPFQFSTSDGMENVGDAEINSRSSADDGLNQWGFDSEGQSKTLNLKISEAIGNKEGLSSTENEDSSVRTSDGDDYECEEDSGSGASLDHETSVPDQYSQDYGINKDRQDLRNERPSDVRDTSMEFDKDIMSDAFAENPPPPQPRGSNSNLEEESSKSSSIQEEGYNGNEATTVVSASFGQETERMGFTADTNKFEMNENVSTWTNEKKPILRFKTHEKFEGPVSATGALVGEESGWDEDHMSLVIPEPVLLESDLEASSTVANSTPDQHFMPTTSGHENLNKRLDYESMQLQRNEETHGGQEESISHVNQDLKLATDPNPDLKDISVNKNKESAVESSGYRSGREDDEAPFLEDENPTVSEHALRDNGTTDDDKKGVLGTIFNLGVNARTFHPSGEENPDRGVKFPISQDAGLANVQSHSD
nr:PREDICTED: uncharacterized protein LOC107075772 [Lepisosteus oculatus]